MSNWVFGDILNIFVVNFGVVSICYCEKMVIVFLYEFLVGVVNFLGFVWVEIFDNLDVVCDVGGVGVCFVGEGVEVVVIGMFEELRGVVRFGDSSMGVDRGGFCGIVDWYRGDCCG